MRNGPRVPFYQHPTQTVSSSSQVKAERVSQQLKPAQFSSKGGAPRRSRRRHRARQSASKRRGSTRSPRSQHSRTVQAGDTDALARRRPARSRPLSHRTAPAAEVLLGRKKGTDGGRGRGPAGHHAAQQRHQSVLPSTHARQEQGARTHAGPAEPRVDPLATAQSNVPAASTSLALKTHTHDR